MGNVNHWSKIRWLIPTPHWGRAVLWLADSRSCIELRILVMNLARNDRSPNRCFAAFGLGWRGRAIESVVETKGPLARYSLLPYSPSVSERDRHTFASDNRKGLKYLSHKMTAKLSSQKNTEILLSHKTLKYLCLRRNIEILIPHRMFEMILSQIKIEILLPQTTERKWNTFVS